MASNINNDVRLNALETLAGHGLKVALYDNSFTPDPTHTTYSTTNELATANGYTQGGMAIPSLAASGTNPRKLTGDPNVWTATGAGFTAYYAVIYDPDDSDQVIAEIDFGGAQTASGGGTFTITWHADGILNCA